MIDNKELHKRLQTESYRIICESISEEEIKSMNLLPEQVIPTINFFKKIQVKLFEEFCKEPLLNGETRYAYYYESYDKDANCIIKPEFENVNLLFLRCLCADAGIKISDPIPCWGRIYLFKCENGNIYEGVRKKYLI